MTDGDLARLFHRLTSIEPVSKGTGWPVRDTVADPCIVTSFEPNDLGREPPPFKAYPTELPVVPLPLPRELPAPERARSPCWAVSRQEPRPSIWSSWRGSSTFRPASVRTEARSGGRTIPFRAAGPRAGGSRSRSTSWLLRGRPVRRPVHAYRPIEHDLVQIGPPPAGGTPALVLTGVPWCTGWRYRERGYRHILWDAGTMLSQQLVLAASGGCPPGSTPASRTWSCVTS